MTPVAVKSRPQATLTGYEIFWQLWPQFVGTGSERQSSGIEVELMGSHTPDLSHVDPACAFCRRVRSVILGIANAVMEETVLKSRDLTCDIDSHANSILCLPALGNRSLVSVSIYVHWRETDGRGVEAPLVSDIKRSLANRGIPQR